MLPFQAEEEIEGTFRRVICSTVLEGDDPLVALSEPLDLPRSLFYIRPALLYLPIFHIEQEYSIRREILPPVLDQEHKRSRVFSTIAWVLIFMVLKKLIRGSLQQLPLISTDSPIR